MLAIRMPGAALALVACAAVGLTAQNASSPAPAPDLARGEQLYGQTCAPCDYNGDDRRGDNLYSNSLLAIDADSGTLRWHFQFTPHDLHDWDSNQVPMLLEGIVNGPSAPKSGEARTRKIVVQAQSQWLLLRARSRDWRISARQPIRETDLGRGAGRARPAHRPGRHCAVAGRHNRLSRSGRSDQLVQPLVEPGDAALLSDGPRGLCAGLLQGEAGVQARRAFRRRRRARCRRGGGSRRGQGPRPAGWDDPLAVRSALAAVGGVLSTGGGLVFGGTREGYFFALDDRTGKPLWRFQTGGPIWANPMSFEVDGRQHVAIASGSAIFVFALRDRGSAIGDR